MNETAGDLLALLRSGRAHTRSDLRRLTGMSRTAVVARVSALADAGLVLLGEELASTGGRPPGSLVFDVHAGVVLAVAIGRSRSQLATFDLGGTELGSASVEHTVGAGPDEVMPPLAEQLAGLVRDAGRPVLGVGLSLPGTVDPVRAVSIDSPVMAGWDGVDLAPYLAPVTDAPLHVGNDADVLALSERLGHAASYDDLLVLKVSTGLGLGIIADGRVVSGHLGGAGEIGHVRTEAAAGHACRCGGEGCLETVAGGWALVAQFVERGHEVSHVRDLTALALGGDADAKAMLARERPAGRRGRRGRDHPAQPARPRRRRRHVGGLRRLRRRPAREHLRPRHRARHPRPAGAALDLRRPRRTRRLRGARARQGARPGRGRRDAARGRPARRPGRRLTRPHHAAYARAMTQVRRATPADAGVLARLLWDFNTEFESETDDADVLAGRFARLLALETAYAVLAEDDTGPVGFALVTLRPAIWFDGPVATLDELYVVPHLRSAGIGTQVLDLSRALAREAGAPEVHINVDEVDADTRRFYERHGFVNVEDVADGRMLCYVGTA